jgi:hypothetical protein
MLNALNTTPLDQEEDEEEKREERGMCSICPGLTGNIIDNNCHGRITNITGNQATKTLLRDDDEKYDSISVSRDELHVFSQASRTRLIKSG